MISQASRRFAGGLLSAGLGLIGFGLLILLVPAFFVMLAVIFFFVIGIGTCATAMKIFLAQRRIDKTTGGESDQYRENVRIHIDQDNIVP